METTTEQISEAVQIAAVETAKKLEMRKEEKLDWRTTWDKELMMVVTKNGMNIGRVKVDYGEMRTYRYENFTLNGELLLEKRYGITETGWEHMPTATYHLDEGTIIYTGW
jgi:hypothetical protein